MKKSIFNSSIYYWSIISFIGALLLWNIYLFVAHSLLIGILPILIQASLLTLILMKHEYAKAGVKYWAIILLVVSSGLKFFGKLLNNLLDNNSDIDLQYYLTSGATILIGLIILNYNSKTVEVGRVYQEDTEPNNS